MKFVLETTKKEKFFCSELPVKLYKELLKCSYGDEPNKEIFVETVCDIFSKLTDKPQSYFENLSIVDLFCLLIELRINSLGDVCKIIVTKDEKKMTLELNLNHLKPDLSPIFSVFENNVVAINDKTNLILGFPCAQKLLEESDQEYLYFIEGLKINKQKTVQIKTIKQAKDLFEVLPPKVSLKIIELFKKVANKFVSINFLSRYGIDRQQMTFLPSLDSLIWFTKLLFNESLESLYDNLFYLSNIGHMNGEYIENSVVGEYNYFVSCLQRSVADKNSSTVDEQSYVPDDEDGGFLDE